LVITRAAESSADAGAAPVMAEAAFEPDLDALQMQERCAAELVAPQELRVPHDDQTLAQQPVGRASAGVRTAVIDGESRDVHLPRSVASNRKPRALDHQLAQSEVCGEKRGP
jgi:hypothetical protein